MHQEDETTQQYVTGTVCPNFIHTLTIDPTLEIVGQRLQWVLDHPNGGPLEPAIWDLRKVSLNSLTLDADIEYLQNRPEPALERAKEKSRAVVSSSKDFAAMRQFFMLLELNIENSNIVYEMQEAVRWIES